MELPQSIFLVFGATGRTGRHFVDIALEEGHRVKALVRSPGKVRRQHANLELVEGSVADDEHLDELLQGVDAVICMLGNAREQSKNLVNTAFFKKLIPAMRRQGVKRLLYQAGGFTRPYKRNLPLASRILKSVLLRPAGLLGQHRDNEAVIEYLVEEAQDIDWTVHRASITSDGPSKGTAQRHRTKFSLLTFEDCARYNYRLLSDDSAIHTYDLSRYGG
ncbi:NAD(P)H-binding protein [Saccharibacillus sp. CPCC 101409]|uniref:NAD(P)-dependent oxidoreductase n=1 Tax=Saccharibacillus sp. CPCC 101409 TaxID=3058041 RepID=UPI002673C648|nr:NAD(P)H-binding protein [Saccharibacillus sp. CPCC 101409]MDO3411118.1 NAD(P)H-binding protein [Saccharibacillus sp. CPCC 101409]